MLRLEAFHLDKFDQAQCRPYEQSLYPAIVSNTLLALSLAIQYFIYALAYYWGARQVRNGLYSQQQFFTIMPALLFSSQSAGQLFSLSPELAR